MTDMSSIKEIIQFAFLGIPKGMKKMQFLFLLLFVFNCGSKGGYRWSHLCPKKSLFFTNLGQGLSSKVGFFIIF